MNDSALKNSDSLREIVKAELHCHLDLCFRHSTLLEIGDEIGVKVPDDPEAFRENWLITRPMKNLSAVLDKFMSIPKFWCNPRVIERLTYEACEDAFHQGVRILELRYAPTFIRHSNPDLSMEDIHRAVFQGIEKAEGLGMSIGLIGIIQRNIPLAIAKEVMDFFVSVKDSIVAVDLADNEFGYDVATFVPLFEKAKEAGLHITIHSGEENVPQAPKFVRDTINFLHAERIGHGLQIFRDPETIEFVKQKGVTLEICPTSNWLTNAVARPEDHPIRQLFDQGVKVTINSDDPGIFGFDLNHEYQVLKDLHGFTIKEFEACNDYAASASFIAPEKKQKHWPRPIL